MNTQRNFDTLPGTGFARQADLLAPKGPLPFSAATLWRYVRSGTFPYPVKLSERVTAWRVADVREWLESKRVTGAAE